MLTLSIMLAPVARALGPGGATMVAYGRGETERALRAELEGFLTSGRGRARDDDRAPQALRMLGEPR